MDSSFNLRSVKARSISSTTSLEWEVPTWIAEFDNYKLSNFTGHIIRKEVTVKIHSKKNVDCLIWKVHDMDNAWIEITPVDDCLYLDIRQRGYYVQPERDYGDYHIESGKVNAVGLLELNPKNASEYKRIIETLLPGYQHEVTVNPQFQVHFHHSGTESSMTLNSEQFATGPIYVDQSGNVTIKYPNHWLEVEDLPYGITNGYKVPRSKDWWTYHDSITIRLQAYFRKVLGIPLTIHIDRS